MLTISFDVAYVNAAAVARIDAYSKIHDLRCIKRLLATPSSLPLRIALPKDVLTLAARNCSAKSRAPSLPAPLPPRCPTHAVILPNIAILHAHARIARVNLARLNLGQDLPRQPHKRLLDTCARQRAHLARRRQPLLRRPGCRICSPHAPAFARLRCCELCPGGSLLCSV